MSVASKIESVLTERISTGVYADGEKLPPLRELGEELNASYVMVCRAVNAMKQKGLLETRKGAGTYARTGSAPAQAVSAEAGRVAFIFADPADNPQEEYQLEVYTHVQPLLRSLGYIDIAVRFDEELLDSDNRLDGVIVMGNSARQSVLRQRKIPAVYCCTYADEYPFSSVSPDLYQGSYMVTEHLIEQGHKRICHITTADPASRKNFIQRSSAYEDALTDHGLSCYPHLEWNAHDNAARNELKQLLLGKEAPTALFVANDVMAFEVLCAVRGMGLNVPEQISIAGLEDMQCAASSTPALTTAGYSKKQLAEETVRVLDSLISGKGSGAISQKISMSLVCRSSVLNCL